VNVAQGRADLNLAHRTRDAIFWNAGIVSLISVGQFCVMLVMVRLLNPEVYGQYGLLMAIMGFLYVFSAQNFVDYALQVRREADVHYQDIFTASVGVNFVLFVIANLIALGARTYPEYANVEAPLRWLSIGFLLQPGRAVRIAMLKRELDWKRIRLLHGIGALVSSCICIPLAYGGAGIYALIVPTFVVPIPFLYDIFFRCSWRPSWTWRFERLRPALKFGANRQFSGFIGAGRRLLETSMLVQAVGFANFGLYGRAIGLAELLCNRLLAHAIETLYPSLTKIEPQSIRFRRVSGLALRMTAWFSVAVAVLVGQFATVIVTILYGGKWIDVILLVSWSAMLAAGGAINFTLYKLLLAHEQKGHCVWIDISLIAGTILSLYFLLPAGLVRYMQGLLLTQVILVVVAVTLLSSQGGLNISAISRAFVPPLVGTFCACVVFTEVFSALFNGFPAVIVLALQLVLYVAIYVSTVRLLFPHSLRELVIYMPKQDFLRKVLVLQ